MKKKFVKPEITQYAAQTAWGQDQIQGLCNAGTTPGFPTGGTCAGGTRPTDSIFCSSGSFAGSTCGGGSTPNFPG